MKIDGYAILAVNEKGDKAQVRDHHSHDYKLQEYAEWSYMNMEETLLPDGLSDCLVMVFFTHTAHSIFDGEYTEWEEELDIQNHVVMQADYKRFEQKQITGIVTFDGCAEYPREFSEEEKEWFDTLIEDWQLLHDEEFTTFKDGTVTNESFPFESTSTSVQQGRSAS